MTRRVLCRADEIAEGAARGFVTGEEAERLDVIVIKRGGTVRAFLNSCPHQSMPLETFPDRFLNEDGTLFVCSTHGARFRVEDGLCVSGPCEGKSLAVVPIVVDAGDVVLIR